MNYIDYLRSDSILTHPLMIIVLILFGIFLIAMFFTFGTKKGLVRQQKKMAEIDNACLKASKDILKETVDMQADIHKDAVKTLAHSIKEGFTDDSSTYCKYCGATIDSDSKFCKKCGKQL